jgi:hypothetical protein
MRFAIKGLGFSVGVAALALLAAQPAAATNSTVEFTGTANVVDTTGVSGPPNTTYATTFDLSFSVNDATPGETVANAPVPGTFLQERGVTGQGAANPVQANLSFGNGSDFSFGFDFGPPAGNSYGEAARAILDPAAGLGAGGVMGYAAQTTLSDDALNLNFLVELLVVSPSNFGQVGVDYNHPFTYTFGPDDQVFEGDGTYQIDAFTPQALPALMTFTLTPETVTVTSNEAIGGVPEPQAWALMILGFGGVGAALRRRRQGAWRVLLQTT